jgi:hypothetical protein
MRIRWFGQREIGSSEAEVEDLLGTADRPSVALLASPA